jgi:superfamily II DNA or RNA helicase
MAGHDSELAPWEDAPASTGIVALRPVARQADGTVPAPHLPSLVPANVVPVDVVPAEAVLVEPVAVKDSVGGIELFASGINGALQRAPKVRTVPVPVLGELVLPPRWRPQWSSVRTFKLTFPDGMEFLPPAPPKPEPKPKKPAAAEEPAVPLPELPGDDGLGGVAAAGGTANGQDPAATGAAEGAAAQADPSASSAGGSGAAPGQDGAAPAEGAKSVEGELISIAAPPAPLGADGKPLESDGKLTRLKPPTDALSLEDRLFYVLQPPLETWLKGQELIMPFEPFPYQYEGIAWLFSQKSALLADEMGLGKTMQTITAVRLLLRSGQARRILLVAPKPLIPNWQREFKTWAEELPLTTIEGDGPRRTMLWTMPGLPILLVNYEILIRDMESFGEDKPKFDLVILDEAQRIKNRGSRTSQSARDIPRKRGWALTGTPIENTPDELASLYEFLRVVPPGANPDIKHLQMLSKQYILRRTKDLVMKDMPPRLDRDAYVELTSTQRYAYDTAEKEGIVQLNEMGDSISIQHVFELVMRLKQICNYDPLTNDSCKLERVEADMEEIAASGGKAILFSQWTRTIDWLVERLQRFNPLVYHGGVPTPKREPILAQFKADPKAHIILMSYATGAVGLNLQFAGYVFLYDRWWNPAVEDQAINRAHRIGCKSQVIVTKFVAKDTIEEKIDRVLNEKRELFRSILGGGEETSPRLSMNASEIFGLFDLKARHGVGTRNIGPKPAA